MEYDLVPSSVAEGADGEAEVLRDANDDSEVDSVCDWSSVEVSDDVLEVLKEMV